LQISDFKLQIGGVMTANAKAGVQWVRNGRPENPTPETQRPTAVITVRMTQAQHNRLLDLAWKNKVSLNTLCITALQHFGKFLDELPAEQPAGLGYETESTHGSAVTP